jgi:NADP-dependent 3-hydroxy acid dehydrogenase YdfG
MRVLADRTAVLTGAAGGIGRAVAAQLAAEGVHLALVDIDGDALAEMAAGLPGRVTTHVADVRSRDDLDRVAAEIREQHGELSIVLANAGVTVFGAFEKHDRDDIDWLLDVNVRGVIHTCHAMLPLLRETAERHGEGHVVITCSMQGMFAAPTQSLYSTSKFAVRGFAAALRAELGARRIGVSAVLPGAVGDTFLRNGRSKEDELMGMLSQAIEQYGCAPEEVGRAMLRGIRRDKAEVVVGLDAHVVGWLRWVAPPLIPSLVGWSYRTFTPEGGLKK